MRTRLVAVVLLAVSLASCSSDSSSSSTTTATSATTAAGNGASQPAFIDIVECENVGGTVSGSGTVLNQGDQPAAFQIEMGVYDVSTDELLGSETIDTDTVAPGAEVEWDITVTGAGDAEVTCRTIAISSGGSGGGSATTGQAAGDGEFPCDLVSQVEVEQLAGNSLEPGDASTNHITENTTEYEAQECSWSNLDLEFPVEPILGVSQADDFPSGDVGCPPQLGTTTPVAGIGTEASWSWSDPGTTLKVGVLRVCTPDAMVQVRVSGPSEETTLQQTAEGLAEAAIAAL